jgi:hypothetical protein|tara:strand:- start:838 stop:1167 length:330 start_codon:yes stop_codon:yes gene_type:complete
MENKEIVKEHVALAKSIIKEMISVESEPDHDSVFAIYAEVCKDKRMYWIDSHKVANKYKSSGNEPMTDRQRSLLEKSGKEFDPACTKAEASDIIKQIYEEKGWGTKKND